MYMHFYKMNLNLDENTIINSMAHSDYTPLHLSFGQFV